MRPPQRPPQPPPGRAPIHTNFTATPPDAPTGQQSVRTPGADELGLIRDGKTIPRRGWRRLLHRWSGGAVNPGESAAESTSRALTDRVNQAVRGSYSIPVL